MKWLLRIGVVLGVLAGLVWWFFDPIALELVGFAARMRTPVGAHRVVTWEPGPAAPTPGERPPNIVLIVADDLGWNDLSFQGGGVAGGSVPTPRIDALAHEGINLTWGYAGNGTCAPSRAAMMSGRYPTRFGFEFTPTPPGMASIVARLARGRTDRLRHPNTDLAFAGDALPFAEMGMPASEVSLAEVLRDAGYRTLHIGKWHLGRAQGMAPHEQGFDESLLMTSGLYLPPDDPAVVNSRQEFDPIDRFLWKAMQYAVSKDGGEAFAPRGYLTDYFTEEAVRAIEANRNRPFFLYLAHWAPHTPLQATRADYDALAHIADPTLRVYAAMIRALDRGVGQVLDALDEHGLGDDTLVIFTSDNGGAHYVGLPDVNQPFRGWKITFFEGGIHVPFFMRWPRGLPGAERYDEPVHHFDIYATAAAAAGAALPADRPVDGVDLLPFLRRERRGAPHQRLFWRQGHYKVVLADGWKLQVAERPDATWLFDLESDPTEQENVAARHPERVAALRARLAEHDAEQADPAWPAQIEAPINIDKTLREPDAPDDEYVYWPN